MILKIETYTSASTTDTFYLISCKLKSFSTQFCFANRKIKIPAIVLPTSILVTVTLKTLRVKKSVKIVICSVF